MKLTNTVHSAHVSQRKEPVNLLRENLSLFEHEFSVEINATNVSEFEEASILKDTIFTSRNLKFYKSFSHVFPLKSKKLAKKLLLFLLPSRKINAGIWITDERSPEYFHWLTDALPRLLAVEEHTGKKPVILPDSYQNISYVQQSLELLSFEPYYYNRKFRLAVKQLYTANHTAESGNYNEKIINNLRDRLLPQKLTAPQKKIFVSRQKALKRRITNEAEIIPLLIAHGYEIHFFEEYDLKKQIKIMSETKSLIGLHGAGLANMLFMQSGGSILELRNEGDSHNNCYFSMASALGHNYFYHLNKGDTEDTNKVDITVDIQGLTRTLQLLEKEAAI